MEAKAKQNFSKLKKILDLKEREQTRHCQSLREISMDAKAKKKIQSGKIDFKIEFFSKSILSL